MKKKILWLILLLVLGTKNVYATIGYANYGPVQESEEEINETNTLEVRKVEMDGKTIYQYRTRDYIAIPNIIKITNKNFRIEEVIDSNIPIEDITITKYYDLNTTSHGQGSLELKYKNLTIGQVVYIDIIDYIDIPEEITVDNDNFNIYDYIDTNIDKDDIQIISDYDLSQNGEYEITIKYNDIEKTTKLKVKILDNDSMSSNLGVEDNIKENNNENKEVINKDVKPSNETQENKKVIYQTTNNNYINNYMYDTYTEQEPDRVIETRTEEKIIYRERENKLFEYITYSFYSISLIILSIIAVRKK